MEFPPPNFAIHVARSRAELPPIGTCVGNVPDQPQRSAVFKFILVVVFLVSVCISVIHDRFFYSVVIVWVGGEKYICSLNHDWRAPANFAGGRNVC